MFKLSVCRTDKQWRIEMWLVLHTNRKSYMEINYIITYDLEPS